MINLMKQMKFLQFVFEVNLLLYLLLSMCFEERYHENDKWSESPVGILDFFFQLGVRFTYHFQDMLFISAA